MTICINCKREFNGVISEFCNYECMVDFKDKLVAKCVKGEQDE